MADINALLKYIESRRPGTLDSLRGQFPEDTELLTPRLILGPAEVETDPPPALLAVIDTAIRDLHEDLSQVVSYVVRRLKLGSRTRTWGAVVSTFAGMAAAALAYLGAGDRAIALSTAAFAALGGLASLSAGALEKSPSGVRVSLAQDMVRLTALSSDVDQMRRVFDRRNVMPLDLAQCKQMIDRLDTARAEVQRLRPEFGI